MQFYVYPLRMSFSCSQNSFLILTIVFDTRDLYYRSCKSNGSSSKWHSVCSAVIITDSLQEFTRFV